ncbi:hypothetical protein [Facilibium subflavum]|uniref:hypothetical protein n=1 Tax=Facilibium subflavum TaxID=2219058 RepID=UPI000E64AE28|nr:hypothetical protein [Facilibium subflavum]
MSTRHTLQHSVQAPHQQIFLPGWGFGASIWQDYIADHQSHRLIDLPDFSCGDEDQVVDALRSNIPPNSTIHAWSLSALWVIRLLQKTQMPVNKLYLYAPPLKLNMPEAKKQSFVRQFELAADKLIHKFLTLACYPQPVDELVDTFNPHIQLKDNNQYRHWHHHLTWMMAFKSDPKEIEKLLNTSHASIIAGSDDVVVDKDYLQALAPTIFLKDHSHLSILQEADKYE